MPKLVPSLVVGHLLLLIGSFGQEITPTENLCHHEILPKRVINLLTLSAGKVLKGWEPLKDSMMLKELNDKLIMLNETMLVEDEETKDKSSVWDHLLKNQKRYGLMLSSVLNSNLDLDGSLATLDKSSQKTYELAYSTMQDQLEAKEALKNMTKMLEDMYNLMQTYEVEANSHEKENSRKSREIELKTFDLQQETNFLVKSLVNGRKEDVVAKEKIFQLENQIQKLNLENEKLQKRLKKDHSRPADCHDLYISGVKQSGVYEIYPYRCYCSQPIQVWCDMKEGGGWTVFMNRKKLPTPANFTRSWNDYKEGFGDPAGEYWIGNEHLHALTSNRHYTLRINMQNRSGKKRWGQWNEFTVASAQDNYELNVGGFSPFSTISKDVLRKHNKQYFSTYDQDNDASYDKNCAGKYKGGWWYGRCFDIHPTGILLASDRKTSVATSYFYYNRKSLIPLKRISMKVKPRSCVPHTLEDDQPIATTCKRP